MSTQATQQFHARVNQDTALQQEFLSAMDNGPEAVVALGQREGFDFTIPELTQSLLQARAGSLSPFEEQVKAKIEAAEELSDWELKLVAGGSDMSKTDLSNGKGHV